MHLDVYLFYLSNPYIGKVYHASSNDITIHFRLLEYLKCKNNNNKKSLVTNPIIILSLTPLVLIE